MKNLVFLAIASLILSVPFFVIATDGVDSSITIDIQAGQLPPDAAGAQTGSSDTNVPYDPLYKDEQDARALAAQNLKADAVETKADASTTASISFGDRVKAHFSWLPAFTQRFLKIFGFTYTRDGTENAM